MTPAEYVELAMRTSAKHDTPELRFENACLGLIGELGEVAEHYKKAKFHGKPLDPVKVLEEIGDLYWYGAQACDAKGLDADKIWGWKWRFNYSFHDAVPDSSILTKAVADLHILFRSGDDDEEWAELSLSSLFGLCRVLITRLGSTQEAVMEANIAKLRARWPDGFKVAAAAKDNEEDDGA